MMRFLINIYLHLILTFGTIFVLVSGCAVEAGNPPTQTSSSKAKVSKFNLYLADAPIDDAVSLKLKFFKVELVREDPKDFKLYSKELEHPEEIDLLKLSDGKSQLLFGGDDVPEGKYDKILLHLDPEYTIFMETSGGKKINLRLPPRDPRVPINVFSIDEKITVEKDKISDLLVHFELRRSVKKTDLNDYVFIPHMQAIPENIKASLNAKVSQKNATIVCAYLKPPLLNQAPAPKVLTDGEGKPVTGVPPAAAAEAPPLPGSRPLDSTSECENADNAVLVKNGEVTFYHLHPQNYDFRIFMADGSFQDFSNIQFLSAEKKSLVW